MGARGLPPVLGVGAEEATGRRAARAPAQGQEAVVMAWETSLVTVAVGPAAGSGLVTAAGTVAAMRPR